MKSRRSLEPRALYVAALFVAVCTRPAAQTAKRPMTLVDILDIPALSEPQLSNDGRQLLYSLRKTDWKNNRRVNHIYRVNSDGTGATQLTFGESSEQSPRWSPDGRRFAFTTVRPDAPGLQIYLMDNDAGEARVLSRHAGGIYGPAGITWSPDGTAIYFLATDPRTDEETQRDRVRADLIAFEDAVKPRHLWKVAVASGAEQRVTSGELSIIDYSIARDGRRLVLQRAPTTLLDDAERSEIWVMDADGTNALQLTRNTFKEEEAQLSPDGSRLLFIAAVNARFEEYYNKNLFTMPAGGGAAQPVLPDFPYEVLKAAWAPDGKTIFVVANMGVHTEIVQVDLAAGSFHAITDGRHAIPTTFPGAWSLNTAAGVHVFLRDEPTRWGDVWTLPLNGGMPKLITHVYDYLERDFKLARQERIEWKGSDGVTVEGLLVYPIDYDSAQKYPLVVQPHGGPEESDKYTVGGIQYYFQALAGKGYFVLRPNYRGSSGYGNAFMRDMVGGFFKNSYLDCIAGVDALIKQGLVDPGRLAIMGHSAGGHITNKIITVTDRFKAASSSAGVANWLSLYSQTDNRARRALWFGGTPYEKGAPLAAYLDQSPLKDAWKVKTPTLLFAGANDERVPQQQAIEMYRALKANGVPTQLTIAPREQHGWGEPRHLLAKATSEIAWFEKYVTNRPYEQERAPGDPPPKRAGSQ